MSGQAAQAFVVPELSMAQVLLATNLANLHSELPNVTLLVSVFWPSCRHLVQLVRSELA